MRRKHILSLAARPLVTASFLLVFGWAPLAVASATDGTIDATNRYAWSENNGWIDFGTTEGNVHVTDSVLSGYAWGESIGWISLNCSNTSSCLTVDYKVTNDGNGTLGGNAWSENAGWIQFAPLNGGVTISSSGVFSGYAWGENIGWIVFNCSNQTSCGTVNYTITTDWRPTSARATPSSSSVTVQTTGGGGHRGDMTGRVTAAREQILARFQQTVIAAALPRASSTSSLRGTAPPPPVVSAPTVAPVTALAKAAERRSLLLGLVSGQEVIFHDVPTSSWFAPYVSTLIADGIAQGYSDTSGKPTGVFGVGNPVTYAEVLKMALEVADISITGLPPPRSASAKGTWASAYVAAAEARGLPVITPDLDVHRPASRAEVVAILLNVLDLPVASGKKPSFPDVPASHRYAATIATAAFYDLVQGNPDGTFRPDDSINRAEAAKLVALTKELTK